VRVLLRRPADVPLDAASAVIGDLTRPRNMAAALEGVDALVHSAGLAHAATGQPEADYRLLNTEATIALAQAAQRAGVGRFVFLSSIRAQSGPTADGIVSEQLPAQPTDGYGRSKLAAEQGLADLAIDWVALRPVLVYGPGVKGNMARLMQLARSPYWLPLGGLAARRSLLALDNLAAAIATVLAAEGRLCRPLIVADGEALTVGEMILAMRHGLGRNGKVFAVPERLLRAGSRIAGQLEAYQRLAGELVADTSALRALGWTPSVRTAHGLAELMRDRRAD
jgi:nucleoside-diphosphate-sugar epimerase